MIFSLLPSSPDAISDLELSSFGGTILNRRWLCIETSSGVAVVNANKAACIIKL